jgi:thioredoxin reductase
MSENPDPPGPDLMEAMRPQAERFGAELVPGANVIISKPRRETP